MTIRWLTELRFGLKLNKIFLAQNVAMSLSSEMDLSS